MATPSGFAILLVWHSFFDKALTPDGVALPVGSVIGFTQSSPVTWGRSAAGRGGLSWADSIVAGMLTVPLATVLTCFVTLLALPIGSFIDWKTRGQSVLLDAAQAGLVALVLTIAVAVRLAHYTFPLAILASLAATAWCRRRLQARHLPSYPSGQGGGQ